MKRLYIALLMCLVSVPMIWGQSGEMSVKEFYLDPTDLTANTPGTMEYDQNGSLAALIKVQTVEDGFTFDNGILGVVATKRMPGEIYLYLPYGSRKLSVGHQTYGTIKNYQFPAALESGKTYVLRLNLPKVERKYSDERRQKMVIQVDPPTAVVYVNEIPLPTSSAGRYEGEYRLGLYDIKVLDPEYHAKELTVNLNDPLKTYHRQIGLKPKFGWITVKGDGDEVVYIDGKKYPISSMSALKLDSGNYSLKVEKPLHDTYEGSFQIQDSLSLSLTPSFVPIYKDLTFVADEGAQIWINGKMAGTGKYRDKIVYGTYQIESRKDRHSTTKMTLTVDPTTVGPIVLDASEPLYKYVRFRAADDADVWIDGKYAGRGQFSVDLDYGTYQVESRKINHKPSVMTLTVNEKSTGVVVVDAPVEMLGTLKVDSAPIGSDVYIDGNLVGKTPYASAMLIGSYEVSVRKEGYKHHDESITLSENALCHINADMNPIINVKISSNVKSEVYIDGVNKGNTPVLTDIASGTHKVRITSPGYVTKSRKVDFTTHGENHYYRLRKEPYKSRGWEIGANFNSYYGGTYTTHVGLSIFRAYGDLEFGYGIFGLHLGCNFNLGQRVQMRPLVGALIDDFDNDNYLSAGVKFATAPIKNIEFTVTPQYIGCIDIEPASASYKGFAISFGVVLYLPSLIQWVNDNP